MHRGLHMRADKNRKRARNKHNVQTNFPEITFGIDDFVLDPNAKKNGHKLSFRWTGPQRIVDVNSNLVFVTETLSGCKTSTVHARRLIHNKAYMENKQIDTNIIQHAYHPETACQAAKETQQIKKI